MLTAMHKTWLEVALNGPWGQTRQPGIPVHDFVCLAVGGTVGLMLHLILPRHMPFAQWRWVLIISLVAVLVCLCFHIY